MWSLVTGRKTAGTRVLMTPGVPGVGTIDGIDICMSTYCCMKFCTVHRDRVRASSMQIADSESLRMRTRF